MDWSRFLQTVQGESRSGRMGVLVRERGRKEMWGGELLTTNNRMEPMAAIVGLEALNRASEVCLTTDSKYVRDGINSWIDSWKKRMENIIWKFSKKS